MKFIQGLCHISELTSSWLAKAEDVSKQFTFLLSFGNIFFFGIALLFYYCFCFRLLKLETVLMLNLLRQGTFPFFLLHIHFQAWPPPRQSSFFEKHFAFQKVELEYQLKLETSILALMSLYMLIKYLVYELMLETLISLLSCLFHKAIVYVELFICHCFLVWLVPEVASVWSFQ